MTTKKLSIAQSQLLALVALAQAFGHQVAEFIADPVSTLTKLCALYGLELEITLDPTTRVEADAGDAGAPIAPIPLPTPPQAGEPALQIVKRRATPQEAEGYRNFLQGRKGIRIMEQTAPGSYRVLLEDGSDVVLPEHGLEFAGVSVAPKPEEVHDEERVRGWQELIAGRTGHVTRQVGAGNYEVAFDDGQRVMLPAAALRYAGCSVPE